MNAEEMARKLQGILCLVMDRWNAVNEMDPLRKLPWEKLDPISRRLYVERCEEFLKLYDIVPKHRN